MILAMRNPSRSFVRACDSLLEPDFHLSQVYLSQNFLPVSATQLRQKSDHLAAKAENDEI